jgi:hypothetical protein
MRQHFRLDAAGVGDAHVPPLGHVDAAPEVGVLRGVREKVGHDLGQALLVRIDQEAGRRDGQGQLVMALFEERAGQLDSLGHDLRELERMAPQLDLPLGHAGDVEQVVHEAREVTHLPLDDDALALHRVRAFAQAHELQGGQDRRKGIAQLVAQHGQELVFGPARRFRGRSSRAGDSRRDVVADQDAGHLATPAQRRKRNQ